MDGRFLRLWEAEGKGWLVGLVERAVKRCVVRQGGMDISCWAFVDRAGDGGRLLGCVVLL